ncbi:hypothetical protein PHLGIDRAFT_25225 [Phlebiopsis gigantea 11061_1 CR5-6]|uniref:tripeptidyl-peptidase II n=1 Tax=Phlebiopsis gigantea (strain 11061_1 CR5-6) TaxID=745531 RepID=A0A0C3PH19_PHLG1|nr:hypothetical protein PHLGIDRAFT_25225 [Phlebiopsis gigantea 11061_1 CR5-6]
MVSPSLLFCAVASTLLARAHGASVQSWFVQERRAAAPESFAHAGPPPADTVLNMRINLAMRDQPGLEAALASASTPGSPSFREWLSKEQVEAFATPSDATRAAVNAWLSAHGVAATAATPAGDWLSLKVPVGKANEMFNTQFALFTHVESGRQSVRTLEYSLPASLRGLVKAVHPTTSYPKTGAAVPAGCSSAITPACLQALYQIPATSVPATTKSTLAVSAFSDQDANKADLAAFLKKFRPDMSSATTFSTTLIDGAVNSQTAADAGVEANLDIQYTVGIATGVPTAFVDVGDNTQDGDDGGFLDIINALLAEPAPPLVLSTSYGFDTEASLAESLTVSLCNSYMQLTARGVSITFATGDGGVASTPGVACKGKPFPPTFPTCPFVTLVGATQGVPEIGASLSAGGFSNYFPQASWQAAAVDAYLAQLGRTNAGLYNASGRAYPDVAAQGADVQVVVDGRTASVGGTSCASPVFSAVVALLNDARLAAGMPPLGFLNPWLYANPQAFNDVTAGSNPGCGTQGFPALAGWDPVTGLGSPNFVALKAAAGL